MVKSILKAAAPGQSDRRGSDRPLVLYVATAADTLRVLSGQLRYLAEKGFDVIYVSSAGRIRDEMSPQHFLSLIEGVKTIEVPMAREITPVRDLLALWRLWRIIRTLRPAVTNVGTPKAGLIGGIAAWLNRIPCRFYTLHGLRFETTSGLKRWLLVFAECLACRLAHRVVCVSPSVREKAVAFGLVNRKRTVVLASGSCDGVDVPRFAPTPRMMKRAAALRSELRVPKNAPVIGFSGRLTRDKGIPELVEAFLRLGDRFPDLRLLLLGRFENEDPIPSESRKFLESHPRVIFRGIVEDPAPYYSVMDLLVLPSHREGLPTVVLEAQAAGKPVVAARATGIVDAVVDGETGLLFPVGDAAALTKAAARLLSDHALARKLGRAGHERASREYQPERIREALRQEYLELLQIKELVRAIPVVKSGSGYEAQAQ